MTDSPLRGGAAATPAILLAHKALGPYKHGNRWRVIVVDHAGTRHTESFPNVDEAEQRITAVNARHGISLSEAIDGYLATLRDRSRPTAKFRLYGLLRVTDRDRPLVTITPTVARDLYEGRVKAGYAGATLHGEVGYAQRFFAWAVEQGFVRSDPFAGIEVTKERGRGKPKLRVNASKQLLAHLWNDASVESTAVLTAFALALRASSVVARTVEDLDDDGRLLWIRDDKTPAGDREIEVPELLRQRLIPLTRRADGTPRAPQERLFGTDGNPAPTRYWLHYHTVRLCNEAGVPRVTPHGLRGSGATNRVRAGAPLAEVARQLGHDPRDVGTVTLKRHYLGGGALESARGREIDLMLSEMHESSRGLGESATEVQEGQENQE
jgi:integrase